MALDADDGPMTESSPVLDSGQGGEMQMLSQAAAEVEAKCQLDRKRKSYCRRIDPRG